MRLDTILRHRYALSGLPIGLIVVQLLGGCGISAPGSGFAQSLFVAECDRPGQTDGSVVDVVLLDWDGGVSPIYPDEYFEGIDLDSFEVSDGTTLADRATSFKEAVRAQIVQIYCGSPSAKVLVFNDELEGPADTVVQLIDAIRPNGNTDIGEGEYDPCNRQTDNAAVIFGQRIVELSGVYSFDEWVNVFANTCAHEIGHTLGFGHVVRNELDASERSLFVELMLDRHTMSELRLPHKFIIEQDNCPSRASRSREAARTILP